MSYCIELYQSRLPLGRQRWRWRAVASNGRKLANGGEAYTNKADAQAVISQLWGSVDTVVER